MLGGPVARPRDGRRPGRRRRRPRPHLVHAPRRHARAARLRHPARPDRPLARAAAAVEARAARRRLRRQQLGRADGASSRPTRSSRSAAGRARTSCACSTSRPERVHVIHNGIDPDFYQPDPATDALERHGVDPIGAVRPVRRAHHAPEGDRPPRPRHPPPRPRASASCCAPASRTRREIAARDGGRRAPRRRRERPNVVWIGEMVSREEARQLYSHAAVFCCPSVYEPFGIINLEAAACETPVVASAVGGIPEVVVDGETGLLVPVELRPDDPMSPIDPDRFELNLAGAINALMADAATREVMGRAARRRAVERFSWSTIAQPDGRPVSLSRAVTSRASRRRRERRGTSGPACCPRRPRRRSSTPRCRWRHGCR